jgi:hypothetical protein
VTVAACFPSEWEAELSRLLYALRVAGTGRVLRERCRKCQGPRLHYGVGRCYACMSPSERERFGEQTT